MYFFLVIVLQGKRNCQFFNNQVEVSHQRKKRYYKSTLPSSFECQSDLI